MDIQNAMNGSQSQVVMEAGERRAGVERDAQPPGDALGGRRIETCESGHNMKSRRERQCILAAVVPTGKHGGVLEHPAGAHDAVDAGGRAHLGGVGQGADVAVGQDGDSNRLKSEFVHVIHESHMHGKQKTDFILVQSAVDVGGVNNFSHGRFPSEIAF